MYYKILHSFVNYRLATITISKDNETYYDLKDENVTDIGFVDNFYFWLFLKEAQLTKNFCCGQIHLHGVNIIDSMYFDGSDYKARKKLLELFSEFIEGVIKSGTYAQILCTLAENKSNNNSVVKNFIKEVNKHLKKYSLKAKIIDQMINPNTNRILNTISFFEKEYIYNGK